MSIGIDLGATSSSSCAWKNDQIQIIDSCIPSYVAFTETKCLIGKDAKDQAAVNPQNTIFNYKRLLGRKFKDYVVQSNLAHWPFAVVSNRRGKPVIQVETVLTPEDISAIILGKIRMNAMSFLGVEVKTAVITVPVHFTHSQRKAVKSAAKIAGLKVRIIDDPVAAAIAYGLDKGGGGKRRVLVVDLGGNSSLVSLLAIKSGKIKVLATTGNYILGGKDFDQCLANYYIKELNGKSEVNVYGDTAAMHCLLAACEQAKHELSMEATANIDSIQITRLHFETLCQTLVRLILGLVKSILSMSNIDKSDIGDIVMAGGSSCIPMVQEQIAEYFGKDLCKSIDPNIVVAYGAAILAERIM
ncbi:Hsp70 chaperone [Coemansia sp. S16]|nr:Hsp70 chaperone [Coemansia sp. S3946]KAJ2054358.1 Hsp70 chaperone [Coemansia sp. S16]